MLYVRIERYSVFHYLSLPVLFRAVRSGFQISNMKMMSDFVIDKENGAILKARYTEIPNYEVTIPHTMLPDIPKDISEMSSREAISILEMLSL